MTYTDATRVNTGRCNGPGIFASNIFDSQDSLSIGIREYVDSKIAETLHGHSCHGSHRTSVDAPANHIKSGLPPLKRLPVAMHILHGVKHFGPFAFMYGSNTYHLQLGIIGIYMLVVLFATFIGPKTLCITIWRLAIALLTYGIAGRLLMWNHGAQDDLLLAPVLYIAGSVYNAVCDVLDQFGALHVQPNV
ncbi:hypothetical protein SVAN01_02159 [Stagonosporopsis vannaccii]|nr:hypothetical protein SVAN01_02159 [Stagonosporopsis vannaccii]